MKGCCQESCFGLGWGTCLRTQLSNVQMQVVDCMTFLTVLLSLRLRTLTRHCRLPAYTRTQAKVQGSVCRNRPFFW